jgi:methyl-accepting chemotaxis protein
LFDLNSTVAINESLKPVIDISHQISIVAINASLISKRAGDRSAGFRVLAIELRAFNEKVTSMMSHLGLLILRLVRHIAQLQKIKKRLNMLQAAIAKTANVPPLLAAALRHKQADYERSCAAAQDT